MSLQMLQSDFHFSTAEISNQSFRRWYVETTLILHFKLLLLYLFNIMYYYYSSLNIKYSI